MMPKYWASLTADGALMDQAVAAIQDFVLGEAPGLTRDRIQVTESESAHSKQVVCVTGNMLIVVVNILVVNSFLRPPPLDNVKKYLFALHSVKKCRSPCFSRSTAMDSRVAHRILRSP